MNTEGLGGFEHFLIENGYNVLMFKNGWVPAKGHLYYSTMGHIKLLFVKGDVEISYGLMFQNHGPVLIHPVPLNFIDEYTDDNGVKRFTRFTAGQAERTRLFEKYSYKEILNAIENKLCLDI